MKKLFCLLFALLLTLGVASAHEPFDPSKYTVEELYEILTQINLYLPAAEGDVVLFEQGGIQICYRNVKVSSSFWRINFMVINDSDVPVSFSLNKLRGNRMTLDVWDNGYTIEPDSVYLSAPNNDFGLQVSAMKEYGIETLVTLDFDLSVYFSETKERITVPVHLDVNYPLN